MVVVTYQKNKCIKYINSVPSRKCILSYLKKNQNLIDQKKIEKKFSIYNSTSKKALYRKLIAMERDNEIICTYDGYYIVLENFNTVQGKVIAHKDGYGFLRTEVLKEDLWLSTQQMKLCIHNDLILADIVKSKRKGKSSAKVLKILKPNNTLIVGRYYNEKKIKYVIPDDNRFNFKIFILSSSATDKIDQESIVVVKLNRGFLTKNNQIKGRIVEVLGKKEMRNALLTDIAIRTYSIPYLWSDKIKHQLYSINHKINQQELNNRVDLRHIPFFTIDEEDACDFDDAVFCKKNTNEEESWDLLVAISDVSYYIKPNTPLDKEAFKRGNSVYFPTLVVPMLPEKISTDLCSLNPYMERLCLICQMTLSNQGRLIKYKHYEAVICSQGRFTYNEIFKIWNGDFQLSLKYNKLLKYIKNLFLLQKIFKKYNVSKKGIYFEKIEAKFILDSHYKIKHIYQNIRNDAHKFIESCMVLANTVSANFVMKYHQYPILFRNHDRPSKDSIVNLRLILKDLKLSLSKQELRQSTNYSNLLNKIKHLPCYEMIQNILLKSMKQAVYSPENCGHFGLSLPSYVHFTSPIRRYPDLLLHRVIKYILSKQKKNKEITKENIFFQFDLCNIKDIGRHCSMTERRADEASRDVTDWLKCDFMQKKIGNVFTGIISNITSFGFFVRLNKYFIDGLVHIKNIKDDNYYFDATKLKIIGKLTKNTFCLGDILKVKVMSVNIHQRKIELSLYF